MRIVRAAEKTLGTNFSEDQVKNAIKDIITKSGKSYFHIDEHFVSAMEGVFFEKNSGSHDHSAGAKHYEEMIGILKKPNDQQRVKILDKLKSLSASEMGCGHLGLMQNNAEQFDLPEGFFMAAYTSALEMMWD